MFRHLRTCAPRQKYQVVMLRHGESIWNKEKRFTGWTDVKLSETGTQPSIQVSSRQSDQAKSCAKKDLNSISASLQSSRGPSRRSTMQLMNSIATTSQWLSHGDSTNAIMGPWKASARSNQLRYTGKSKNGNVASTPLPLL